MSLELKNVEKKVGIDTHIHPTSLKLEKNTINVLLGSTLAGKTTLMQIMAGLDKPTSGEIWFDGKNVTGMKVQKRNCSMVYQQFINYPNYTVYENIASPLAITGVKNDEIKQRVGKVAELLKLSEHPKFVGIGETGLDYYYTKETEKSQKESLLLHIEAAQKSNLPLIIHARSADKDIAEILANEYRNAEFTCVMHCFSSGRELAKKMLDLGFFLSMSGIITFPKSDELRDIFSLAPLDQILVETDSPYLAPPPYRGKRNQPAYVTLTAKKGAELFNLSYEQFAEQLERNFDKLFVKAVNYRPNT